MEYSAQLQTMHEIACAAGQQIMQVYESGAPVEVATKATRHLSRRRTAGRIS